MKRMEAGRRQSYSSLGGHVSHLWGSNHWAEIRMTNKSDVGENWKEEDPGQIEQHFLNV